MTVEQAIDQSITRTVNASFTPDEIKELNENILVYPKVLEKLRDYIDLDLLKKNSGWTNDNIQNFQRYFEYFFGRKDFPKVRTNFPSKIDYSINNYLAVKKQDIFKTNRAIVRKFNDEYMNLLQRISEKMTSIDELFYFLNDNAMEAMYIAVCRFGIDEVYLEIPYGYEYYFDMSVPNFKLNGMLLRVDKDKTRPLFAEQIKDGKRFPLKHSFYYSYEKNKLVEKINNLGLDDAKCDLLEQFYDKFMNIEYIKEVITMFREYGLSAEFIKHFVLIDPNKSEDFYMFCENEERDIVLEKCAFSTEFLNKVGKEQPRFYVKIIGVFKETAVKAFNIDSIFINNEFIPQDRKNAIIKKMIGSYKRYVEFAKYCAELNSVVMAHKTAE